MSSAQALTEWAMRTIGVPIPESEYRQLAVFGSDGRVSGLRTPPTVQQQILAGMVEVDWTMIRPPALAIYAAATSRESLPGCRTEDTTIRQACGELFAWMQRHLDASQRLLAANGERLQLVEPAGANPFVFLSHPREVEEALDRFLATLPR